jgi:hypothetical protein
VKYLIKLLLIILFIASKTYPQAEYVPAANPVYNFLERMENYHLINNYNSFEIPKSRNEIAGLLSQIITNENRLNDIDKRILNDLKTEFELEISGTLNNSASIIGGKDYDLFSQDEKYLFALHDPGKASIFINLLTEGEFITRSAFHSDEKYNAFLGTIGGEIRGTFLNKFGFGLRGSNGNVFGEKAGALVRRDLVYNYKLNESPEQTFFDDTEGYLTADFDIIKFKIGRDRINLGYGNVKTFLGNYSPKFDYLSLNINYNFFNFSFFHGKLLGELINEFDSISGGGNLIDEKYVAYHRIGFNLSRHADFGIGELIIYGQRPIDLSYLNPFNFYKSIEHANQDRDNAMLFADFNNNSIKGLKIFAQILIDDIAFSKIGTGWWGNQTLFHAGIHASIFNEMIPADVSFEYIRVEPFTYTHRLSPNNFTNFGFTLTDNIQPNSELFFTQINYRFNNRLSLSAGFIYTIHGANPVDDQGNIINVGGDINLGHRLNDSEKAKFLDGDLEYFRSYNAVLSFEPYNGIGFYLKGEYILNSLKESIKEEEIISFFGIAIKL